MSATINWNNTAGQTDWASGGSWLGGNAPANSLTSDVANFASAVSINAAPVLSADRMVTALFFDNSGGDWSLGGTGTLSINPGGTVGSRGLRVVGTGTNTTTISANLNVVGPTGSNTQWVVAAGNGFANTLRVDGVVSSEVVDGSGNLTGVSSGGNIQIFTQDNTNVPT